MTEFKTSLEILRDLDSLDRRLNNSKSLEDIAKFRSFKDKMWVSKEDYDYLWKTKDNVINELITKIKQLEK